MLGRLSVSLPTKLYDGRILVLNQGDQAKDLEPDVSLIIDNPAKDFVFDAHDKSLPDTFLEVNTFLLERKIGWPDQDPGHFRDTNLRNASFDDVLDWLESDGSK